ncbi:MAG TPA: tetratricopeptide repeat protein, partial [Phototrophicaceae bacterium]|nr:tetratricopeptide repeat protein [Phototrophicaceae bacterium]
MSELTLQEYQSQLDELLQRQRNDEVVQHCRHILTYFPKNVAIYRLMGRALVGSGRYAEAGEVLRRVLSVDPADYHAHLGLSRVAQHDKQGDQALWHLERAFEQDPNNKALLDQMHDLYRQYRGIEQTRFQLTARAVASQQLRAGLYAQALDTLHKALAQSPERIDLKPLMMRVLWENGYTIEAAETAVSILKTLPDCLDANQIMTQLWLKEQRPSDAQRYLSRIEAIDPYLAFELAQGAPPPDNAYRIAELDYEREASRQLATGNPDWLQSLDSVGEDGAPDQDDLFGDLIESTAPADTSFATETPASSDEDWMNLMFENGATSDADTDEEENNDWLQELDQVQSAANDKTRAVNTENIHLTEDKLADLFGDDESWMTASDDDGDDDLLPDFDDTDQNTTATAAAAEPMTNTGLTGLLSSLGNRNTGTGLTGLLNVLEGGSADEEAPQDEDEDDWMRAVNKPTAPLRDPFKKQTTTDLEPGQVATQPVADNDDDVDPLAWLNETVDEPANANLPVTDGLSGDEHDPLAWMKQSGIEFVEDAPETMYNPTLDTLDDNRKIRDPNEHRPMAWMENAGIEFEDNGTSDQFAWMDDDEDERPRVKTDDLPTNESDPLAWMRDAGIAMSEEDPEIIGEDTVRLRRKSAPIVTDDVSEEKTNELDWLGSGSTDQLDELLDLETMVELGTGILSAAEQDRQDAMTDDNDNLIPDWLSSGDDDDETPDVSAGDGGLEWLNAADDDGDQADSGLDWMKPSTASVENQAPSASAANTPDDLSDLFGNLDDEDDDEEVAAA